MTHQRAQRVLLAMPVTPPAPALRRRELEHPAGPLPRPDERVEEVGDVLRGVVHLGMPGGDYENGALGGAREARDDQPARRTPKPAGRQTQFSPGEGVSQVLERPPASHCGGLIGHATCGLAEDTSKRGGGRILTARPLTYLAAKTCGTYHGASMGSGRARVFSSKGMGR